MTRQEAKALFEKYKQGVASPEERVRLERWYHQEQAQQRLSEEEADFFFLKDVIWEGTLERAGLQETAPLRKRMERWPSKLSRVRMGIAAALILIALGFGAYFYFVDHTNLQSTIANLKSNDIAPGGNRATLTLADGRSIVLDEAANGELAEESGIKITKTEDGQLVYEILGHAPQARASDKRQPKAGVAGWRPESVRDDPATYNTIQTPRGGKYKIILPDSSVVWLNANSRLRYPTRFVSTERRVELTGEAYFKISSKYQDASIKTSDTRHKTASAQAGGDGNKSKIENRTSKIPFIVATATQEVTVLGTEFNISAYDDEPQVKTTLVSGSVRLMAAATGASVSLVPGEQGILADRALSKQAADVESEIAWKDGYFKFDGSIQGIMAQIGRWYDVEVVYEEGFEPSLEIDGRISRNMYLHELLGLLQEAGENIHFKQTGRRIEVTR